MISAHSFWTAVANSENAEQANQHDQVQAKLEEVNILAALKSLKFKSLLEVGCATGSLLAEIQRHHRGKQLTGLDFIPEFIHKAKQQHKRIKFQVGNVTHLDFPPKTFDVVVSRRCLINLSTVTAQQKAISEIHRVLKPDGTFIMVEASRQGYEALNKARAVSKLPPVEIASHNNPLDTDNLSFDGWTTTTHDPFNSYYYLTRVVLPLLTAPKEPEYNTVFHYEAAAYTGGAPHVSPMVFWSLKKT